MSSLDFDQDAFYICTETSPRCFVVQKAIQMDRGQIERVMKLKEMEKEINVVEASLGGGFPSSDLVAPPAPPLPHWFNEQCRRELLAADAAAAGIGVGGFMYGDEMAYDMSLYSSSQLHLSPSASLSFLSLSPSPLPPLAAPPFLQPRTDIKALLRAQLEYYFSRENLATDRYLRCQMDSEQFVSISIIAGFRKIVQLTNDYGLIVQTLRESPNVEVDERGEKVRPLSKRCTILIRQLGEEDALGVREMLSGGPAYVSLRFGVPSSWYVTYDNEEATQRAYIHLQNLPSTPNNQPICARIKTGGPPADTIEVSCLLDGSDSLSTTAPTPIPLPPPLLPTPGMENVVPIGPVPSPVFDLGRVLASLGYYPRATYRPGNTVVHVDECVPLRNPGRDKPRMPPPNLFNGDGRGGERRGGGASRGRGGSARGAGRGAGGMRMMNGASGDGRQPTTEKRREGTLNGTGTYTRRTWNENGGMSGNANGSVNGNFSSGSRRGGPSSSFRDYHGNHHHGDSSKQLLGLNNQNREPERGTEGGTSSEKKNCPSPIFAFEENSFPSLIDENPSSPPKEEKLSFSFVAAGKKREPVEPKKSYAQSLHVAE